MGRTPLAIEGGLRDCVRVDNPVALLGLALVTIFGVIPVIRGIAQAASTGNAWAPFESRGNGRDGLLAPGRYFSALRAPREGARTTPGLVARWGFWAAFLVVFGGIGFVNAFLR
jgi:hypothetical protein